MLSFLIFIHIRLFCNEMQNSHDRKKDMAHATFFRCVVSHAKIIYKKIFTHKDFTERYNAYKGTALGLAHTLRQTAVFRPSHSSKKVKNLYYTGHYNHPGIGVPMVIISSQILAEEIKEENI